jgi:hypothetical protein
MLLFVSGGTAGGDTDCHCANGAVIVRWRNWKPFHANEMQRKATRTSNHRVALVRSRRPRAMVVAKGWRKISPNAPLIGEGYELAPRIAELWQHGLNNFGFGPRQSARRDWRMYLTLWDARTPGTCRLGYFGYL